MRKLLMLTLLLPAPTLAIFDVERFDLNHWRSAFYNYGCWGHDETYGADWPQPLNNSYVSDAGLWFGAVRPSWPETLCTAMSDIEDFEAFPTLCRHWRDGAGNFEDHIFKYPDDWPPYHSRFPMAPQWRLSDMDLWCCFCDSHPGRHHYPGRPLGIDVYLTVYGFDDSLAQDFFFLRYEVANCAGDTIRQAHFGMMLDPNIGDRSDDVIGLILDHVFRVGPDTVRVRNTAFAYDYDNCEQPGWGWESGTPGTVAIMLLSAPDSLGLTAFKQFTPDTAPVSDVEQYLSLAGYNYKTRAYEPYDSTDTVPGDKTALLATGPFDLAPDSTVTFWYAVIGSPFGDSAQPQSDRDTSELALRCKWALEYFGRLYPGVAEQTPSDEVPMTNAVTIVKGVLALPEVSSRSSQVTSSLVDISGRNVMDLRPGANDVRDLAPGVYLVREEPQAPSHKPQAARKIVITK